MSYIFNFIQRRKKYPWKVTSLIDVDYMRISSLQICVYIGYLQKEISPNTKFGYKLITLKNGLRRFQIYGFDPRGYIIQYFKDRCPGTVEKEIHDVYDHYKKLFNITIDSVSIIGYEDKAIFTKFTPL